MMNIFETNKRREKKTFVLLYFQYQHEISIQDSLCYDGNIYPRPRHIESLGIFHFYTLHTYEPRKYPFSVIHPIWADENSIQGAHKHTHPSPT